MPVVHAAGIAAGNTARTLVVHGDLDGIVTFEVSGKRTDESVAHASPVLIDGGPHGRHATHARQFYAALLEFLAGARRPA